MLGQLRRPAFCNLGATRDIELHPQDHVMGHQGVLMLQWQSGILGESGRHYIRKDTGAYRVAMDQDLLVEDGCSVSITLRFARGRLNLKECKTASDRF